MTDSPASGPGTIELGGKTYLVSKPTDSDIASIGDYVRKQAKKIYNPVKSLLEDLKDLPKDLQEVALKEAIRLKNDGEPPEQLLVDIMTSPLGARFLAYMLIRKNHPEVTLKDFETLITDDNCMEVYVDLDHASGMDKVKKGLTG